jgi:HAD superfamily hydrolase (TIGR01509 family)
MDNHNKIKLIISDLDGCLVNSRELHYHALNRALAKIDPKYIITEDEHHSKFDGLPTTVKLNMLTKEKGLPLGDHSKVWKMKQEITMEMMDKEFTYDERIRKVLKQLKDEGYILYCASNAVLNTVKTSLLRKGFLEYFDFFTSTEFCQPKPSPDVYLKCIMQAKVSPRETLILEVCRLSEHHSIIDHFYSYLTNYSICMVLHYFILFFV